MKRAKGYENPFSPDVMIFAQRFDVAYEDKNIELLLDLLKEAKTSLLSFDAGSQAQLHYSLGTVYGDLTELDQNYDRIESLEKQIYHFRQSIDLIESSNLNEERFSPYVNGLKRVLYTNYANSLDKCGRKIAALEYYEKALKIDSSFGMAMGNIGVSYYHYAILVYDNSHRDYLHHFAYQYLSSAVNSGQGIHETAMYEFRKLLAMYDKKYVEEFLKLPLEIPQYSYNNPDELSYRKWVFKNKLFLNPLNDLPIEEMCFASDVLQLPSMIVKIQAKPVCHGMFNQMKQEYVFARYQCYQSLQYRDEPHYADKDTFLLNFADYPQYSIRIEQLKTAFRFLYSLLDKVSYFINTYFRLGIKGRDITFRSIWKSEKQGSKGYKYTNELKPLENFPLSAIYWICKDFFDALYESPNPAAKRISDLRNALEHKYVKVYSDLFFLRVNGEVDDLAEYISESELSQITLQMLKVIREVLINLSLAVNIEEQKRSEQNDGKLITQISFSAYDDKWKI